MQPLESSPSLKQREPETRLSQKRKVKLHEDHWAALPGDLASPAPPQDWEESWQHICQPLLHTWVLNTQNRAAPGAGTPSPGWPFPPGHDLGVTVFHCTWIPNFPGVAKAL